MAVTLIVLYCSGRKRCIEQYPNSSFTLRKHVPNTYHILDETIKIFKEKKKIDITSPQVSSLSLYQGHFYNVSGLKEEIYNQIKSGKLDFLIMSAGYGFVHPLQKIHEYDVKMKGLITRWWRQNGLHKVLEEYVINQKMKRIYGFFAKTSDYKKIFEDVNWQSLKDIEEAGYYYLQGIRGPKAQRLVPETLGKLMLCQIKNGFQQPPILYQHNSEVIFHRLSRAHGRQS